MDTILEDTDTDPDPETPLAEAERINQGLESVFQQWDLSLSQRNQSPLQHQSDNNNNNNRSSIFSTPPEGIIEILITEDQVEVADDETNNGAGGVIPIEGKVVDSNKCGCVCLLVNKKDKGRILFSVVFILVVSVVTIVAVVSESSWYGLGSLSKSDHNNNNNNETETETETETTIQESKALVHLRSNILYNITEYSTLYDYESPQYQSMKWLADEDEILVQTDQDNNIDNRTSLFSFLSPDQYKMLLQRYAMTLFYYGTNGPNWTNKGNFLHPKKHICEWGYYSTQDPHFSFTDVATQQNTVGCNSQQEVETLLFLANRLKGTLPVDEFVHAGIHKSLIRLEVDGNKLNGPIPKAFQYMTNLNTWSMSTNSFTGSLPYLGNMADSLEVLKIIQNELNGTITRNDTGLDKLKKLRVLHLSNNQFSGTIPSDLLAELNPVLQNVELQENNFWGNMSSVCLTSSDDSNVSDGIKKDGVPGILYVDCIEKVECSCCSKCT